jgi:hypothetical protein
MEAPHEYRLVNASRGFGVPAAGKHSQFPNLVRTNDYTLLFEGPFEGSSVTAPPFLIQALNHDLKHDDIFLACGSVAGFPPALCWRAGERRDTAEMLCKVMRNVVISLTRKAAAFGITERQKYLDKMHVIEWSLTKTTVPI